MGDYIARFKILV